jgi:Asp-tRNA(Asn)/Glu-tRNA(Gln) amidotransferase A subunit family amidase
LAGKKLAVVKQTVGAGVADDVSTAVKAAMKHLESLGATIEQVRRQVRCQFPTASLAGIPAASAW